MLSIFYCVTGGKLVYLYTKKAGATPKCGDCKEKLRGVCMHVVAI